jgi:hypothetical protein
MFVVAHAVHWLEPALFALPAAVVVASIFRARRNPASHSREEATEPLRHAGMPATSSR